MRSDVLQEFFNSLRFSFVAFLLRRQKKSNLQPDIHRNVDSASATIILPPEFVLDPPNQPVKKFFNPMLVVKFAPSLRSNEVTCMVKALDQKRIKPADIKVRLNGVMRL